VFVPVASTEQQLARDPKYPCCTFRGSLVALDARDGRVVWRSYTVTGESKPTRLAANRTQLHGPAGVAIASAPTIDRARGLIYVTTGDAFGDTVVESDAVMAFDMNDGARKWTHSFATQATDAVAPSTPGKSNCRSASRACPRVASRNEAFASSPMIKALPNGKQLLIVGQLNASVSAIDLDDPRRIVWKTRVGSGSERGGIQGGMTADDDYLYVANSDVANHRDPMPGITALKLLTGERVWYTAAPMARCSFRGGHCERGFSAPLAAIKGAVFAGALDGRLYAYNARDGASLWEFDAGQTFATTNGGAVSGGAIDSGGPIVSNGRVIVNAGVGLANSGVLLVFGF
jgi:polyvinyl alcohol dehydrogenase (cytochrome)